MKKIKDKLNSCRFTFTWKKPGGNLALSCLVYALVLTSFMETGKGFAQSAGKQLLIKPLQDRVFIKEQGQFRKNARETKIPISEPILYGVENGEFTAYFTAQGIVFQFPERRNIAEKDQKKIGDEPEKRTIETIWHTAKMRWVNADSSVGVLAEDKVANYYNYGDFYGGYDDKAFYNFVPAYKKIRYTNLYPGVDAEFELPEKGGIKYRFIVQPNITIPNIAMQWEGLDEIGTDDMGNLLLTSKFSPLSNTSEWKIMDHAPNAFTAASHADIPVDYKVTNNKVEFQFSAGAISSPEGIIIDPWITVINMPSFNRAFDIQEDSLGNVFIHGNHSNFHIEKYNAAGVLQWSYVTYSVFLGDIAVDNPGNTYIIGGYCTGKRQKLNPAGVQVWAQGGLCEEWRLAFNYSKTVLAVCGYFVNPGGNNLARLNMTTGAVSDQIAYNEETRSIATDCNGDMYSLHLPTNTLRKTNADFTPAGVVPSGLALIYSGTGYAYNPAYSAAVFQGFNGVLIQGPYLYIYDGITLRRFNKSTLTPINSVAVPNGVNYQCSGLSADPCGNVYAGSTTGIVKFDSALVYIAAIPTPGPVYDIILGSSGELLACGAGFVGSFSINCTPPPPLAVTSTSTNANCSGGTASLTVTGGFAPYTYLWQPSGETIANITNLAAGTYTYSVTDPFCHSYLDSIVVNQTTTLILEPGLTNVVSPGVVSHESCPNSLDGSATVEALGGTGPYTYFWNTNPVQYTQTATGLAAGIYLATVIDADTCRDTVSIVISRNPDPVAAFGYAKVCQGNSTVFIDSSSTASGTIASWNWDFGDGTVVNTSQNPSHLYANAGMYVVTLIINNNFGCADTIIKPVQVYYNPIAGFTVNNVCFKDSMYFTNTSAVHNSTTITSYLWVFGDGSPSDTLQNQTHYYSTAGTYTVTCVATTAQGCSNTAIVPVKAFDPPANAFSFDGTCLFEAAVFTNTSLDPVMGTTAGWSWDFGDGSPLNTTTWSPVHLYGAPGNYPVTLTTYSSNLGCPDTLQTSITIFPMPLADFSFINVCLNQTLNFTDLSTVSSGNIAVRSWDLGDGSPLQTGQNPGYIYANPGTYAVTLIVTTDNGCKDTVTKNIVVHPLPVAQFSALNVCDGSVVQFNDLSGINPTDTIQSWAWNFGDGSAVNNNQNTSHLYASNGAYTVELLIVSNFGCLDSISKISIINPNPVVSFTADDTVGCETFCVNFQNLSSVATGSNATGLWNFGDGSTTAGLENPNHCYINDSVYSPNYFNVTLTVTSDSGCVSTLTKNNYITVYPNPVANFTVQPESSTITDPVISFTDISGGTNFWNWNFGDGSVDFTTSLTTAVVYNPPPHTFADTGSYQVTLITSTQYGCADTAYQTIIIDPDFMFYIPNAFSPDGDGINDVFTGKGLFIRDFEMAIFDRWGNLVFFSDHIDKPWDGRANHGAEIAQVDVYVYSIKITDFKKIKHNYKGIVTLVR